MPLALCFLITTGMYAQQMSAQDKKYSEIANYDQSKVPEFVLPDPLVMNDGTKVTSVKMWEKQRRPEISEIFQTQMYGKAPGRPKDMHWEVISVDLNAFDGKATRKDVAIYFGKGKTDKKMNLRIYLPNQIKKPAPVFLGISFGPNYTVVDDPGVEGPDTTITLPAMRFVRKGSMASSWQLPMLLERGYGLATFHNADLDPDTNDFSNGVHTMYYKEGQTHPATDEWGAIAAWAWGASRAMDYFEKDRDIDHKHVGIVGHSRNGKAAVWAGANDQRFALVLSGNSGCGGVALSKRKYGETIEAINVRFPHWFCDNYKLYNDREEDMPFDQHELVAFVAPRPIYIASGQTDNWSDQKGEFLGGKYAEPVYELYGLPGIGTDEWPAVDEFYGRGYIGYHNRTGGHAVTAVDWEHFLDFADLHFSKKK